jgi:hypothetical protein
MHPVGVLCRRQEDTDPEVANRAICRRCRNLIWQANGNVQCGLRTFVFANPNPVVLSSTLASSIEELL